MHRFDQDSRDDFLPRPKSGSFERADQTTEPVNQVHSKESTKEADDIRELTEVSSQYQDRSDGTFKDKACDVIQVEITQNKQDHKKETHQEEEEGDISDLDDVFESPHEELISDTAKMFPLYTDESGYQSNTHGSTDRENTEVVNKRGSGVVNEKDEVINAANKEEGEQAHRMILFITAVLLFFTTSVAI